MFGYRCHIISQAVSMCGPSVCNFLLPEIHTMDWVFVITTNTQVTFSLILILFLPIVVLFNFIYSASEMTCVVSG